ncbi:hypothetical protein M9H77_34587 [Catharanthus roseus]|uniref:Uncharacterized protein n=1 Tax=Catharanthus roseus TaxID=4058 RepID=A0ACB9ZNQ3_CATRO|nr:hypothetical protein M9H77_34587 [Catharanthus roseus]
MAAKFGVNDDATSSGTKGNGKQVAEAAGSENSDDALQLAYVIERSQTQPAKRFPSQVGEATNTRKLIANTRGTSRQLHQPAISLIMAKTEVRWQKVKDKMQILSAFIVDLEDIMLGNVRKRKICILEWNLMKNKKQKKVLSTATGTDLVVKEDHEIQALGDAQWRHQRCCLRGVVAKLFEGKTCPAQVHPQSRNPDQQPSSYNLTVENLSILSTLQ